MKKILSVILALTLVLGLCAMVGCGSESDTNTSSVASDTNSTESSTVKVTTVSDGKLIMATNAYFAPYDYGARIRPLCRRENF